MAPPTYVPFGAEPPSLSLDSTVKELRAIFAEDTTARLSTMEALLARLKEDGPGAKELVTELCDHFHKLAGTGGMYGFPAVSTVGLAGQSLCTDVLEGRMAVGPVLARWHEAVAKMRVAIADRPAAATRRQAAARPPFTRVLLCADADVYTQAVPRAGPDCAVVSIASPGELAGALDQDQMSAVVVVPGGAFSDTPTLLRDLRAHANVEHAPILLLADRVSLLERIEYLQLGATRILGRDTPWEVLFTFVTLTQPESATDRGRIFILENQPELAVKVRGDLAARGYQASSYWDLPSLLAGWQEQAADLLLVGRDTAGGPNWPVLETIRKRERLRALPIVVLLDRCDETNRALAFARGADDYLPLPYLPEELAARVDLRLQLGRAARKLDLLTSRARSRARIGPGLPPAEPFTPEPTRPRTHPPRVLLADDDPVVARLLEPRLRAEGWEVIRAADGEQAERAIARGDVDLVVLDLNMPFRSGFDVLQWMSKSGFKRHAKVAVLSALNREETILRAFSLEADDFIGKPFNPEIVATRLRRLLRP
jgi:DNA-binding response OmpR family regulator